MKKRLTLLTITLALAAGFSSSAFCSQAIFGAVGQVPSADNAHMNGTPACRVYSVSGTDTGINNNQNPVNLPCWNARCPRNYNTGNTLLGGGYVCQGEGTSAYNNDADGQTFYEVVDAEADGSACNHVGFYAVQGGVMSSTVLTAGVNSGNFASANCSVAAASNCFSRADLSNADQTPLTNTNATWGPNLHQIGGSGGLSPIPVVRVGFPGGGCAAGQARLTWDNPETYAGAMKNGVASPVLGVRLYQNLTACTLCPNGRSGWAPVSTPECPGGLCGMSGGSGTCVPITGPTWFALSVRLQGPGNAPNSEIETGFQNGSGFVGANSQCVSPLGTVIRITNVSAHYAGRGRVAVNWTSGSEGGVQSFYVVRGASAAGPYTRISEAVTPAGDGQTYSFQDRVHTALGRTQYYAIEIVDQTGSSENTGPSAVVLPAAKKKLGTQ